MVSFVCGRHRDTWHTQLKLVWGAACWKVNIIPKPTNHLVTINQPTFPVHMSLSQNVGTPQHPIVYPCFSCFGLRMWPQWPICHYSPVHPYPFFFWAGFSKFPIPLTRRRSPFRDARRCGELARDRGPQQRDRGAVEAAAASPRPGSAGGGQSCEGSGGGSAAWRLGWSKLSTAITWDRLKIVF